MPSIGLAAGARIAQAPELPPAPVPGAAGRRCKAAPGTVRDFSTPLQRAQASGASTVRGHIYLSQITPVPVVVRERRTSQCPPLLYTSPAISLTAKRRKFWFYRLTRGVVAKSVRVPPIPIKLLTVATPYILVKGFSFGKSLAVYYTSLVQTYCNYGPTVPVESTRKNSW